MEILKNNYEVLHWVLNPDYFEMYDKVICEAGTSYHWETVPANTADFTYTLYFRAKDNATGQLYADYRGQLLLNGRITDEKQDALQVLGIVKELSQSVNNFIKANTAPHAHRLQLHNYEVTEHEIERMEAGIRRLKDKTPYDEQSDQEKQAREILKSIISNTRVNTVVTRIDIADK